jgi:large subunit ribosomal protein L21
LIFSVFGLDKSPKGTVIYPLFKFSQEEFTTMYAVLEIGGRQYQVSIGQTIMVNRLAGDLNDEVPLKNVLLVSGEDGIKVGSKELSDTSVRALIKRQLRGPKRRVFKTKRRTGFQKTIGHRQDLTELLITDIFDGSVSLGKAEAASDSPAAEAPLESSETPQAESAETATVAESEPAVTESSEHSENAEPISSEDSDIQDKGEE